MYADAKGPFWVMEADAEAPIIFAKKGPGSKDVNPPTTMLDLLRLAVEQHGEKTALRVERVDGKTPPPEQDDCKWQEWTYKQYMDDANMAARALMHMGVEQFGSVGIYGFNSPEWFLSEISTMFCGAKTAGIYPSDRVDNVVFKLKHSKASVIILEDEGKLSRLQPQKNDEGETFNPMDELPELKHVVMWAPAEKTPEFLESKHGKVPVITWADFMKLGEKTDLTALEERQKKIKPGHCCALIYTSGTTGRPKAVMISHDNITFVAGAFMAAIKSSGIGKTATAERLISYLPLSHIAGMVNDIIAPIYCTARTAAWSEVSFARPYDLKKSTIANRLRSVKPTLFLGVPRVWEKIADKLKAKGAETKGLAKTLSQFAKPRLLAVSKGQTLSGAEANPAGLFIAKKVSAKIKAALGLDELKFGFTGAAPIQVHTLEYFGSLGINIKEVYGMSECSAPTTISTDETHEWGSCGFPMPGIELKVLKEDKNGEYVEVPRAKNMFKAAEEEQGELCFRGRHIMMGYLANPDFKEDGGTEWAKKKNVAAIDKNGWLHSGDKGCMDKNGMVKITGRYKELIIGAGGENVAPVPIEANVKKLEPAVSNIMMVGDKRKFIVALVALKVEGATGELAGTNKLEKAAQLVEGVQTVEQAMDSKEYVAKIWEAIQKTNKDHSVVTKGAASIKRFTIIPRDFSVEGNELTSTLKLKRSVVEKMYHDAIEKIYDPSVGRDDFYVKCFETDGKTEAKDETKEKVSAEEVKEKVSAEVDKASAEVEKASADVAASVDKLSAEVAKETAEVAKEAEEVTKETEEVAKDTAKETADVVKETVEEAKEKLTTDEAKEKVEA